MDWISTLKTLAPTVASALGGPLAGAAVTALGSVFGVSDATQDKIADVIRNGQMTGEQVAQIRALELQFQNDEKERGFRYSELEFQDTKSARDMQTQTKSRVPAILATVITTGFFGILIFLIMNTEYKPTEPLLILLGSLSTGWTVVVGFYFGSSHGSQQKDAVIAASRVSQ